MCLTPQIKATSLKNLKTKVDFGSLNLFKEDQTMSNLQFMPRNSKGVFKAFARLLKLLKPISKCRKEKFFILLKKIKEYLKIFWSYPIEEQPKNKVFILDTVFDTGKTINSVAKLFNSYQLITHSKS